MKFLTPQITYLLTQRESRRDLRALLRYLAFLTATIAGYSAVFHLLMIYEGQEHSWITGVYWTLTVMSTLGFGDITFQSDAGRFFSIVVLLSGIVLLLIVRGRRRAQLRRSCGASASSVSPRPVSVTP